MWSSLLGLLLAFPPMTAPRSIAPHHYGTPLSGLTEVAVASAGGEAWAFWVDDRRDRSFGVEVGARADLWMARIGPDGALVGLIPQPGCLAPPGVTFEKPRAVSIGNGGLLVAWVERRQASGGTPAIRVAPLNPDGRLDCPTGPLFEPPALIDLELGTNGATALLAWSTAAQVDVRELTTGGLHRDAGLDDELLPGSGLRPAVAGVDGGFVVSWVALDAGVLSQALPGTTPYVTGPGTAVALVARQQGVAQAYLKGNVLYARELPTPMAPAPNPGVALPTAKAMLVAPWDADALLAIGWEQPGDTRWSLGVPGMTFQAPQPFVPGFQPRAATAFPRGALAVAQALDAGTAPLAAFVLSKNGVPAWDGGSVLSCTANQWSPSAIWANGWWMVGHDEASTPDVALPEFHQWRVDPNGALSEAPWFALGHARTPQLLQGGGRVGLLTVNDGEAIISELTQSGNQYSPGPTLSSAGEALRFGALGALDTLQWAAGTNGTFTALHAIAGQGAVPLTHQGTPGRCAVAIDRTFYLPVWRGSALELLAFDGNTGAMPTYLPVKTFAAQGQRPCVAANGDRLLVTWATGSGVAAAVVTPNGNSVVLASLPDTDAGDVEPVVAAVAGGWALAWEARNTTTGRATIHGTFVSFAGAGDLQVTKLGLDTVHSERRPALASSPTGQAVLAWSAFDEATGQTTTQVRVIGERPGRPDAGSSGPDGGTPDGGVPLPDAGLTSPDGGSGASDGGTDPNTLVQFESCACEAVAPSSLWLLAALALRRRRGPPSRR